MNKAVYITKSKVWLDKEGIEWKGNDLLEVFKTNKNKLDAADIRVILGNDVCYLAAFIEDKVESLSRENVLIETKNHVPLDVEDDCFDWKSVQVDNKGWIQAVVIDEEFLGYLRRAVKESGVRVRMMIPIAILIGQRSLWKKGVVMIKWSGPEKLTILANRGLVDSVFEWVEDGNVVNYAKNKWKLETSPEILILDENNVDINKEAFGEKYKGDDAKVLSISVLGNPEQEQEKTTQAEDEKFGGTSDDLEIETVPVLPADESTNKNRKWIWGLMVLIILMVLSGGWWILGRNKDEVPVVAVTAPTPTPTATPAAVLDLGKYSIRVLNGSGETGLAAGIRDVLQTKGFVAVEVGNAPETVEGTFQTKLGIPGPVIEKIRESLGAMIFSNKESLPEDSLYDVIVIIGSTK